MERASGRPWLLPVLAAELAFLALVARFAWVCDDAFISFRFARQLAAGQGLTFNPGLPPVEGYSNLLWVLLLTPVEALGLPTPTFAVALSTLCGALLVARLGRLLFTGLDLPRDRAGLALAFAATLPPLAVWATGGLATMPFALALFTVFEALAAEPERPRLRLALVAAAAAVLLRADGAWFLGALLAGLLAAGARARSGPLLRATLAAGGAAALAVLAQLLFRWSYYGELAPNTARVKVGLDGVVLERGLKYLFGLGLNVPSLLLATAALALLVGGRREPRRPALLAVPAATVLYVLLVGGDFMAMGRFTVAALPFLTVAFALALARIPRPAALALGSACVALSLLAALGVQVVSLGLRERAHFRWSADRYRSELDQWRMMKDQAELWAGLGRALGRHTAEGESLIHGTIGAVGYYSPLTILDPFGLVNREPFRDEEPARRRSPGHQRRVPLERLVDQGPTYLDAALVPSDRPNADLPRTVQPGGPYADRARSEWLPCEGIEGVPEGWLLRLVRYSP
jgi:hypothetical protein